MVYRQEIDAGRFVYEEGTERTLRHKPILDADFRPADADIALAYSVATFSNGMKSFQVMRRYELDEVRESSQTGAQYDHEGNPRESKGPWREWLAEMCKKTVIRRHSKTLPQSGDIMPDVEAADMEFAARSAVALLDRHEPDEPVPVLEPVEPTPKPDVDGEEVEPEREAEVVEAETVVNDEQPVDADVMQDEGDQLAEGTDQMGVTLSEHDALADEFINRARHVELLTDLRKLEREAEIHLAQMPPEIASAVDAEFAAARTRITPKK